MYSFFFCDYDDHLTVFFCEHTCLVCSLDRINRPSIVDLFGPNLIRFDRDSTIVSAPKP